MTHVQLGYYFPNSDWISNFNPFKHVCSTKLLVVWMNHYFLHNIKKLVHHMSRQIEPETLQNLDLKFLPISEGILVLGPNEPLTWCFFQVIKYCLQPIILFHL